MREIWQKSIDEIMHEFSVTSGGLTSVDAKKRNEKYGYNELPGEKKKSPVRIFFEQFADFLVIVLIVAAVISAVMGDVESMAVILAVITMNAILGTVQTIKAESSLDSLKKMSAPVAKAMRDGKVVQIPGRELTIGDIILLEAGDCIGADARLIECASLKCAESALTGESLPVEKDIEPIEDEVPLGDRRNMVFSGSFVTYGRAKAVVTGIGSNTEMGKIAMLLKTAKEKKTPLQLTLDAFGQKLTVIILILCAILFAVSVFIRHENIMSAFLFAIALAVAAIPEALSSIVTIVLSLGTSQMAKENAIIRKLQAVEGLGSVSVICSDKTGTLTQNKMTVKKIYTDGEVIDADRADFAHYMQEPLLRCALLCCDATVDGDNEVGDPTETALVRLGLLYNISEEKTRNTYPRVGELPFDSDRKMMSTVNKNRDGLIMVTKGAVDVMLSRCIITDEEKAEIERINEEFSKGGLRVLAFASKGVENEKITLEDENDLTFLGLIAMMDPPRLESRDAVSECIRAGIRPVMITGDHKITASAIAKEIGILTEGTIAVEGAEIEKMSDEELIDFVEKVSVYARVSPEHKIRIVRAWQERGNLVAMTGDGVNDAPALKQADIGVAMGITGTEVAKDAAGMVLTDDNFATIVKAVKNGRNVYANIKKAIGFLLSGNTAGILAVLYASFAMLPVPFAAVHLLFINLLTDSLPAIALGLEPHTDSVMDEKPRPRTEGILTKKFMTNVIIEGLVIAAAVIAAFHVGLTVSAEAGSTMAFATLCLSRLFHGFSSKTDGWVLFTKRMFNNKALIGAFFFGAVLLSCVMFIPALSGVFEVTRLSLPLVGAIAGLSFGSMVVNQIIKLIKK
ncbi:MAG: cation-translocating P-type ATPase [Clostridia bacterium]|nr:cation-translocating P-type ATPase [Clostridia bacterium]